MATSYVAGATGWSLVFLPLLAVAVYRLCFPTQIEREEEYTGAARARAPLRH